jgi:hypothetical protein
MKRLELLKNETGNFALYDDERQQMRESLMAYMEKVPVRSEEDTIVHSSPRFGLVLGLVVTFLIVGTGVTFAAQSALPGEKLYPIKVGVNEKVLGLFAVSPSSKAEMEAHFAAERLEEAQILFTQERLDDETRVELQTNFKNHMAAYEKHVTKVKVSDVNAAASIDANFKSSLAAHAIVLPTMLGNATNNAGATTTNDQNIPSSNVNILIPSTVTASTTLTSQEATTISTDLPVSAETTTHIQNTVEVTLPDVSTSKLEHKDSLQLNVLQ